MATETSLDQFEECLLEYFIGDRAEIATRDIDRYLHGSPFTGRWFEHMASADHPNHITADDLLAVTMLGVTVPPECAYPLVRLGDPETSSSVS